MASPKNKLTPLAAQLMSWPKIVIHSAMKSTLYIRTIYESTRNAFLQVVQRNCYDTKEHSCLLRSQTLFEAQKLRLNSYISQI